MAKSTFRCRLIAPDAQVFDEQATAAVFPAWDGLVGVLPNRAPMVMEMGTGELRVEFPDASGGKGGSRSFFVDEGFVQMVENELTILASTAISAERLTETEAQAELNEANARRTEGQPGPEVDRIRKARVRASAKLRAAKNFGSRGAL